MTKEKFIEIAGVPANGFVFRLDNYDGFVACDPAQCYICAYNENEKDGEPNAWGIYGDIYEMLDRFEVEGTPFVAMLDQISELIRQCA